MDNIYNEFVQAILFLNSGNIDKLRGPYATRQLACEAITNYITPITGKNYREGKFVEIGVDGDYVTYWWKGGYTDDHLVKYTATYDIGYGGGANGQLYDKTKQIPGMGVNNPDIATGFVQDPNAKIYRFRCKGNQAYTVSWNGGSSPRYGLYEDANGVIIPNSGFKCTPREGSTQVSPANAFYLVLMTKRTGTLEAVEPVDLKIEEGTVPTAGYDFQKSATSIDSNEIFAPGANIARKALLADHLADAARIAAVGSESTSVINKQWYSQQLTLISENGQLYDESADIVGTISGTGGVSSTGTNAEGLYSIIQVEPLKPYFVYWEGGSSSRNIGWYNAGNVKVGNISTGRNSVVYPPADAVYMYLGVKKTNQFEATKPLNIKVEQNTVHTPGFDASVKRISKLAGYSFPESSGGGTPLAAKRVMSVNLFNGSIQPGKGINPVSGAITDQAGYSLSEPIAVRRNIRHTIWSNDSALTRYVRFEDASHNYISHIAISGRYSTFNIPANAAFILFEVIVPGSSSPIVGSRVQLCEGGNISTYHTYMEQDVNSSPAFRATVGKTAWIFGASVAALSFYETNWPSYIQKLGFSIIHNFAVPGAQWKSTGASNAKTQMDTAMLGNYEAPDVIFFDLGTNDQLNGIGDFEMAIDKLTSLNSEADLATLDLTEYHQAMLYGYYRMRLAFPNALLFTTTFFQKAKPVAITGKAARPNIEAIRKVAKWASVYIIDQFDGLPILQIFEKADQEGRYTRDGQHPNEAGQRLEGEFIVKETLKNLLN